MQLAAYIRMSTVLQEDSPETQKSILAEYCKKNGHTMVKTYIDAGISGGSMEKRPALLELLKDAESRLFEGVIVYKYDRAFRNLEEQVFVFKRLRKHGIKVIAAADPGSDGASGELIVNILGAVNQFERQLTGERIRDKRRELAKKGRWTGSGRDPFGYRYNKDTKSLEVVEDEAETVRLIFDLYLRERSLSRVVDILYALGKKTKTGNDWSDVAVHQVLTNPICIGKLRWGFIKPGKSGKNRNCEVFDGQHEAIISSEVYQKAREILAANKRFTSNHSANGNLLGGLLRCSICGGIAVSNVARHRGGRIVYYCKDRYTYHRDYCPGWHRMGYKLEGAVYAALIKNINRIIGGGKFKKQPGRQVNRKASIEKKIAAVEEKLRRQIEMYEEGIIDKETFAQRRLKTLKEKEHYEAQLKEAPAIDPQLAVMVESVADAWQDIDRKSKREILQALIHGIHTDGEKIKIEFVDLGIPGWELEAEMPVK